MIKFFPMHCHLCILALWSMLQRRLFFFLIGKCVVDSAMRPPCYAFYSRAWCTVLLHHFSLDDQFSWNLFHLVQINWHILSLICLILLCACAACPHSCAGKMSLKGSLDHRALCQHAIKSLEYFTLDRSMAATQKPIKEKIRQCRNSLETFQIGGG